MNNWVFSINYWRTRGVFNIAKCLLVLYILSGCSSAQNISAGNSQIEKVIKTARSYKGTPYQFGGTTQSGMDCSGLLYMSFSEVGLHIPRTSEAQNEFGKKISLYSLRPGDLVFFSYKKYDKSKPTHVGLVTEVNGKRNVKFIHASTKLGVTEDNVYQEHYREKFIMARRPF